MKFESKYSFTLKYSREDEGYLAQCPEFPNLSAFGDTPEEAVQEARVALELFIETYHQENKTLPEPITLKDYSGQIRARLPKSLHARLSSRAQEEGVSLNTLMIQYLSEGLAN
ncbi:MAG: type II toxin-antitoxin system HicB family antitoxin, partial [Balneolales bacterium]